MAPSVDILWRPKDKTASLKRDSTHLYRPEVLDFIEETIESLSDELRALSIDIHEHPELMFKEYHAHAVLTAFMRRHGWHVETNYILETGWKATFDNGPGGRTIGVNSEMDALPGVGHACGHNLIAIAGVGVGLAIKAALQKFKVPGKVVLLGTPAEEGGGGKIMMEEKGAYKGMAACLMCHPAPGPRHSVSLSSSLAISRIEVAYTGHSAHAALSPWEGTNALDACVLAYNNVSALRQQIRPTHRVHGIFKGNDWAANIIPDNSSMLWYVRAPTFAEVLVLQERVINCFKAASIATSCEVDIKVIQTMTELRQNKALGDEVARITKARYGSIDYEWGIKSASTDFGNITYVLPSLHPGFAIPTEVDGGNHTPAFTVAAKTPAAHAACLDVCKALAGTGFRVIDDDAYFEEVKKTFEEDKGIRGA